MNVMAYDIRPNPRVEAMGIKYYPWEDILPAADMVSLHLPLLPSTKYFIDVRGGGGRSIKHKTWGPGRAGGGGLGAAPLTVPRGGWGGGRGRARQRRRRPRTTHHPLVTPSPALAPPPPPQARKIAMMKPGVTLLNVSRGALIDTRPFAGGPDEGPEAVVLSA